MMNRDLTLYCDKVAEVLDSQGIRCPRTNGDQSVTFTAQHDGSGFTLSFHVQAEKGIVGSITVKPFRGQCEVYGNDNLEQGIQRGIAVYHGRSNIRFEPTEVVSGAYPVPGLRVHSTGLCGQEFLDVGAVVEPDSDNPGLLFYQPLGLKSVAEVLRLLKVRKGG